MACESCKREIKVVARGLCRACYQRWHKTGTTEYQRWGKQTLCQIKDCGKPSEARELCAMHYRRWQRHGHTEQTRPDSWGAWHKHPLKYTWQYLRRYRGVQKVCEEWQNDFLQFVADVGERPSPKHKLFAADESKPIGPGNFVWKRSLTERVDGEDEETFKARRARARRAVHQEAEKSYNLKKDYGLSREKYDALHAAQNGKCAICGTNESLVIRGKKLRLAVDHCHDTGAIRGLLCSQCNTGLGCFGDDPDRVEAAARYLRS